MRSIINHPLKKPYNKTFCKLALRDVVFGDEFDIADVLKAFRISKLMEEFQNNIQTKAHFDEYFKIF